MDEGLVVEKTHCVDEGERGPDGFFDYRYAYWRYIFRLAGKQLGARRYDDTPQRVSITSRGPTPSGSWTGFTEIPYGDAFVQAAVRHLVEEEGASTVDILFHGEYVPIDLNRMLDL